MALSCAPLPDDVETLKRLLIGRDELIEKLKAEIARLKRWRFGRSSERSEVPLNQLQLALDELQVSSIPTSLQRTAALEPSTQAQPKPRELRRSPRSFPEHLPRETIVHAPSCLLSNPALNLTAQQRRFALLLGGLRAYGAPAAG